jgi:hypothetical protein
VSRFASFAHRQHGESQDGEFSVSFELKIGVAQELIDAVDAHNDRGSAARAGSASLRAVSLAWRHPLA